MKKMYYIVKDKSLEYPHSEIWQGLLLDVASRVYARYISQVADINCLKDVDIEQHVVEVDKNGFIVKDEGGNIAFFDELLWR